MPEPRRREEEGRRAHRDVDAVGDARDRLGRRLHRFRHAESSCTREESVSVVDEWQAEGIVDAERRSDARSSSSRQLNAPTSFCTPHARARCRRCCASVVSSSMMGKCAGGRSLSSEVGGRALPATRRTSDSARRCRSLAAAAEGRRASQSSSAPSGYRRRAAVYLPPARRTSSTWEGRLDAPRSPSLPFLTASSTARQPPPASTARQCASKRLTRSAASPRSRLNGG